MQVYERYKDRDVLFFSLTDETAADLDKVRKFAEQCKIPWPIGYGALPTHIALQVDGPPMTFVVARDGTVTWNSKLGGSLDGAIRQVL